MMGSIKDATGSFTIGLLSIAMGALVGAVVLVFLGHDRRLENASGQTVSEAAAE